MAPQREWFEKDYYEVLGVPSTASEKDITRAYRKRMLREQTALAERASESLVEQLLPVLDNFELALLSLDDADEKVRKGVELVYADFLSVLERAGLERIATDGEPFDPEVHEAVAHEAGDGHPTVVETMREGYRLKGRVLRPAMVKVAG